MELFSDWSVCDACGLPPYHHRQKKKKNVSSSEEEENNNIVCNNKSSSDQNQNCSTTSLSSSKLLSPLPLLMVCRNCKSVAYHNVDCQKDHWIIRQVGNNGRHGHRHECKRYSTTIQPLQKLMCYINNNNNNTVVRNTHKGEWWWWLQMNQQERVDCDRIWSTSVYLWKKEEYIQAMEGFQLSLRSLDRLWNDDNLDKNMNKNNTSMDTPQQLLKNNSYATVLAQRLLFCSYCEADGNQVEACRNHLVQCLSIILLLSSLGASGNNNGKKNNHHHHQQQYNEILNDAWMELMLTYEEQPSYRRLSRHVANLAITSTQSCCGWTHPLQRPGYMAKSLNSKVDCPSFVHSEDHPEWCRVLEENWKVIAKELAKLQTSYHKQSWNAVGSGDRGSGSYDHRVVSAGGNWKEYVLFGTGAMESNTDAPITKRLLRQHVPSAVSLAQAGGGEVIFSRLAPETHIEAHCGPTNIRWTAHLGLVVPPPDTSGKCQIRIASKWYQWQAGKILLFDDSYEHEICNDTTQERTVLLLRFWHPSMSVEQRMIELNEAQRQKEMAIEKRYHPPL